MEKMFIHSLDIGTSKVVLAMGEVLQDKLNIVGVSYQNFNLDYKDSPFNGEYITNFNLLQKTIKKLAINLQNETNYNEGEVIANVSGCSLHSIKRSASYITNEKVITKEDLLNVLSQAKDIQLPKDYMVLDHVILEFEVDGHLVDYPIGMVGYELKANVLMIIIKSNDYSNIQNSIVSAGLSLGRIVPTAFLSAFSVADKMDRDSGICVIDMGAGSTNVAIYERGLPRFVFSIPVGGNLITQDISNVLSLTTSVAEGLKRDYGNCVLAKNNHEVISFVNSQGKTQSVSKAKLCAIIASRVSEVMEFVKQKVVEEQLFDKIRVGVALTGGVANMKGIAELVGKVMDKPTYVGKPKLQVGVYSDLLENCEYATLIGGIPYFKLAIDKPTDVVSKKTIFDSVKWLRKIIKIK